MMKILRKYNLIKIIIIRIEKNFKKMNSNLINKIDYKNNYLLIYKVIINFKQEKKF
jgi:hypothetical protein